MENCLPRSLEKLQQILQISLEDLPFGCIFCGKLLGAAEKQLFKCTGLCIVWHKGWPYGTCRDCTVLSCALDLYCHLALTAPALEAEALVGQEISSWFMRCTVCGRRLTIPEKIELRARNCTLCCIDKGQYFQWRGHCSSCKLSDQGDLGGYPPSPGSRCGECDECCVPDLTHLTPVDLEELGLYPGPEGTYPDLVDLGPGVFGEEDEEGGGLFDSFEEEDPGPNQCGCFFCTSYPSGTGDTDINQGPAGAAGIALQSDPVCFCENCINFTEFR
ncbi:LE6 [Kappapapillomavirus 2]|uniref:Protein E6 n=3 Tax=Kappapapillomavirus 2 TaxID=10623 RepID=VE6_CRPVK|nr:LE6 [Kappapapillomavirus 2]P03127.1 RecName: Full=Protein E6 [Papillomavirus sylvilagi (STRAIN KANSAS)]pir/W6WLRB/ E6 protein - cottontail rabbit papillomavirus [Kappapapillomavirus 2]CAB96160.1 le6 [Kappapapillomavirus 2]